MLIFPAIDLLGKKAVRLLNGDYGKVTVFDGDPLAVARKFRLSGAEYLHTVDLDGAKSGTAENFDVIETLAAESGLKIEVGGGIRNKDTVKKYFDAGVRRVILGTAAYENPDFLSDCLAEYGDGIVVGVDLRDGKVALKGWTEKSSEDGFSFCEKLAEAGVKNIICTDISKDGAMKGTNRKLYTELSSRFPFDVTASGGISGYGDIGFLSDLGIYGAIVGRALYTGAVDISDAIRVASRRDRPC
jgi:phosphoribosylformimino-5-aminoimidazole carboxamide ribotide isomerase